MRGLFLLLFTGFCSNAIAATPLVKASAVSPASIKAAETFSLSYYLINSNNRRVSPPSGIVDLYSYTDSQCISQVGKVGDSLDLSISTKKTYSIAIPGVFYLKPTAIGYTGNCVGPLTVNSAETLFQKLELQKSAVLNNSVSISVYWLDNSNVVAASATEKATIFLSQNQNCSSRITGTRSTTLAPKNGISIFKTILPQVSPVYACAASISGQITAQAIELTASCSGQQVLINGACSDCPQGTSYSGGKCIQVTKACSINNGTGISSFNLQTSTWGDCILSGCNNGFHLLSDQNNCEPDSRSCSLNGGSGTENWQNGYWSSCTLSSCDSGYHQEGNFCYWNQEACANTYCISIRNCFRGPSGLMTWTNGSGWGPCIENLTGCQSGNHKENGICVPDVQSCSIQVDIDNVNYDSRFQQRRTGVATGVKRWNHGQNNYSSCQISSCPLGSHLEGSQCRGNLKNARWEGGILGIGATCYYDQWSDSSSRYHKHKLSGILYGVTLGATIDYNNSTSCPTVISVLIIN